MLGLSKHLCAGKARVLPADWAAVCSRRSPDGTTCLAHRGWTPVVPPNWTLSINRIYHHVMTLLSTVYQCLHPCIDMCYHTVYQYYHHCNYVWYCVSISPIDHQVLPFNAHIRWDRWDMNVAFPNVRPVLTFVHSSKKRTPVHLDHLIPGPPEMSGRKWRIAEGKAFDLIGWCHPKQVVWHQKFIEILQYQPSLPNFHFTGSWGMPCRSQTIQADVCWSPGGKIQDGTGAKPFIVLEILEIYTDLEKKSAKGGHSAF